MSSGASAARELREDLGLTDLPAQPEDWCEAMSAEGFRVAFRSGALATSQFEGMARGTKEGAEVFVNESIRNRQRRRFTAAHEVGHVCQHIATGRQPAFECTADDIQELNDASRQFEKEANDFASELLMPSDTIDTLLRRNDLLWGLLAEITRSYDVSLLAAARRAIHLSREECCLVVHDQGKMWTPFKSRAFEHYIPTQPFPRGFVQAAETRSGLSQASLLECDFSDWGIELRDLAAAGQLAYSSVVSASYDRIMTLLVVSEADEEDFDDEPRF